MGKERGRGGNEARCVDGLGRVTGPLGRPLASCTWEGGEQGGGEGGGEAARTHLDNKPRGGEEAGRGKKRGSP